MIGLAVGIFAGIFFGEPAAVMQPVADAYIRLMQMTVLPYLISSLVIAIGQLGSEEAKRLATKGAILLLIVWALTALVIVIFPMTFPEYTSASFYSNALVEPRQPFSFTDIYFTANLFDSLSRNIVPAVVLFSCLVGIGLIGLDGKERLLAPLRVGNEAIVRMTKFIIDLTPYGVFAIGCVTAGTMDPETLTRLEVYFIAFSVASLLLAFWVLPLLVTAVTPFSYREVAGIARDALLTAFVANSAFIVLPILVARSKELLERHGLLDENTDSAAEVLIPVMFNFPNAGKLLTLLFLPFAAWLSGAVMTGSDYPVLLGAGIPSYFAKAQIALPFLLDLFSLPHDLFQLYIPTTIITGKFDSLVTAMNLLVFAFLGAGAMGGFLTFQPKRLLRAGVGIAGGMVLAVIALRMLFAVTIDTHYDLDERVRQMHKLDRSSEIIVHRERLDVDPTQSLDDLKPLERIQRRGTLRIGYDPVNLPMSFFNSDDELVGFDVVIAEQLASALKLKAEFIPIGWSDVPRMLDDGEIDVMPGMWYRPYWFSYLLLSDPYFFNTIGLAVKDERRHDFDTLEKISRLTNLKIAVPLDTSQIEYSMKQYFNSENVEFVTVHFWQPFFEGKHPEIDAFLMPAEHASGWTILHPEYTVVVPQPNPVILPVAFGVARENGELATLINEWVVYASNAGIVRRAHEYWIAGQGAKTSQPRWSIIRDVLGWVE
jgi:Na+/H+-dicarboxylate symporter